MDDPACTQSTVPPPLPAPRRQRLRQRGLERDEALVAVAPARDEPDPAAVDVRQATPTVVLQFIKPVGIVKS